MKCLIKSAVLLALLVLLSNYVNSQRVSNKERVKTIANIIAVDKESFLSQKQIFIVHIEKLINGKEKSPFIKVIYQNYGRPPYLLTDLLKNKSQRWKFELLRDTTCDTSLEKMKYSDVYLVENLNEEKAIKIIERAANNSNVSTENTKKDQLLRLEDLGGLQLIPDSQLLPCYNLNVKGVKNIEKR